MDQIYFNTGKHHLSAIAQKIANIAREGQAAGDLLLQRLTEDEIDGTYRGMVDVYHGHLTPDQIKGEIAEFLCAHDLLCMNNFRQYLEIHGKLKRIGHYVLHKLSDGTVMTLRFMENDRQFVHVHPGRHSPNTFRIKLNTLKTAVLTQFLALSSSCDPLDIALINQARVKLHLSPVSERQSSEPASIYDMLKKLKSVENFPLTHGE